MRGDPERGFSGWRMVFICSVAQNVAQGLTFASFGPLLASTEQHFGVSRAVAATGMSAILLAFAGLAPVFGSLLHRLSVRKAMIGAAIAAAAGYAGLALATSFLAALAMFCLIGGGAGLLGVLGPVTMVTRWFAQDRAKALSLVSLPIALFLAPFAVGALLPVIGRSGVLGGIAAIFLAIIPLLLLLVDDPTQIGQAPHSGRAAATGLAVHSAAAPPPNFSGRAILASPAFWLLSLAIGIMAGSGSAFVVHIVPFGAEHGLSPRNAAGLLSIYAGAGIFGTLLFGWLADRIGPPFALAISTLCQAGLWWGLLHVAATPLFLLAAALGICVVPVNLLHGAAMGALFGADSVSRAMGLSYAIKLPFLFVFAPAAGYLFERAGSYALPFVLMAVALLMACLFSVLTALAARSMTRNPVVA